MTDIIYAADYASGGVFFPVIYFTIYIILFIAAFSTSKDSASAIASASYAQFVVALLMVLMGLDVWYAGLPIIFIGISLFLTKK
jgi:hypothetical protein